MLTLRILSYRNEPVPGAAPVRFADAGGTLGRSPENALVLDDPGKTVSRVHARVLLRDGAYYLEDVGSNPSIVNDRPLGKGSQVALAHGDRIAIGEYQIRVALEATHPAPPIAPAPANDPTLPLFVPPAPPLPVPLPPFEEGAPAALQSTTASPPCPAQPDALAGASLLDIDAGAFAGTGDDPLGLNLFGSAPPAPAAARAAESDHLSPELAALTLPPVPAAPVHVAVAVPAAGGFSIPHDYDPLADLLPPPVRQVPPAAPAVAPAVGPVTPPVQTPVQTPPQCDGGCGTGAAMMIAATSPPAGMAPAPAPSGQADDGAVLQALLRGLGLPGLAPNRPAVEVAETVGALLREATAGTMDVLMARALTKKESRIDMTMLSVRANNPLKFFPHAEGALTQMLTGAMAGYMPPLEAVSGAFDDLRAHEMAVIAGMRAALTAVLHRFDPAQIESRLGLPTMMDKMHGAGRKAKMWDRLVELYGEIAAEADEDVQRLFSEKFSEAYEEQVARLRQARQ